MSKENQIVCGACCGRKTVIVAGRGKKECRYCDGTGKTTLAEAERRGRTVTHSSKGFATVSYPNP